ncbi:MAG TPA: DUF1707 domain-containing protein [Gemmatimonadales bacterium]|nr:DUF1707 domain-containing protein [Gemmatimonadales bacterium]
MNTIRASDSEREEVERVLQKAAGAGRLSIEEAGERVAQAQSARFREELAALISDLPEATEVQRAPIGFRRPPVWAWLVWGAVRLGVVAMLCVGLGLFALRWLFFPFWPLALLFFAAVALRRRWWWRRRMYWGSGRPYWHATRYEF